MKTSEAQKPQKPPAYIYSYWDNHLSWHGELLLEIQAKSITEADATLQKVTGHIAQKTNWIGCTIKKIS